MSNRESPLTLYGLSLASGAMILIGWGGLFLLIRNALPTPEMRWVFFLLLYIAIAGTTLPFVRFLNFRFVGDWVSDAVVVRESLWCGLYITTCAWLQIPRVLNWPIAILLALAVIAIEGFLRLREGIPHDEG